MRITNAMMINKIMNSLRKNKEVLGQLQEQLGTGKKIQKPSDNPIIAVRALKLRSSVREVEQYQTNIKDAQSWMGVTEQAFKNMSEILKSARDLLVQNANETLTTEDREIIINGLKEYKQLIVSEGNVSYAGRYVFTGYKTDKSLVYTKDNAEKYRITESFTADDIETIEHVTNGTPAEMISVHRIELAYDALHHTVQPDIIGKTIGNLFPVNSIISTDANAYQPPAGQANYLEDTGEIILGSSVVADFPNVLNFTYEKHGFKKYDMNPQHYFDCEDLNTGVIYSISNDKIEYQTSYNQNMTINTLGKDVITSELLRDFDALIHNIQGIEETDSPKKTLQEDVLSNIINDSIEKFDKHIDVMLKHYTNIGTSMKRLELTYNRLDDDRLNYKDLMSENENVDVSEVIIQIQSQEMVYQAALMASGRIIQPTLLEFLR